MGIDIIATVFDKTLDFSISCCKSIRDTSKINKIFYYALEETIIDSIKRKNIVGEKEIFKIESALNKAFTDPEIYSTFEKYKQGMGLVLEDTLEKIKGDDNIIDRADLDNFKSIVYRELEKSFPEEYTKLLIKETNKEVKAINNHIIYEGSPILKEPPVKYYLRYGVKKSFVGREEELKILHQALNESQDLRIVSIAGLGGVGKTQLVAEYTHNEEYKKAYTSGIFWVDAAEGIYEGVFELCRNLCYITKSSEASDKETKNNIIRSFYYYLNDNPSSLLIIDNLKHPKELFESLSIGFSINTLNCKIIFTTRNSIENSQYKVLCLNELEMEKAIELFRGESGRSFDNSSNSKEYIKKVIKNIGGFPLAIIQVAAYLKRFKQRNFESFLNMLEKDLFTTLDVDQAKVNAIDTTHSFGIKTVLKYNYDQLRDEKTLFFIKTAALMPESSMIPICRVTYGTGIEEDENDLYPFLVDELYEWRLVEKINDQCIRLHPLIREFVKKTMEESKETKDIINVIADNYVDTFQRADLLGETIKSKSIYAVIDELQIATKLLPSELTQYKILNELNTSLKKNSYQIKNYPFSNSANNMEDYVYQFLWHAVYFTKAEKLKESLKRHFKESYSKIKLINYMPSYILEYNDPLILTGHRSVVNHASFDNNCDRILTCSYDGTAKVWNVENGKLLYTITKHKSNINYGEFSSDGKIIATCSEDMSIGLWEADSGKVIAFKKAHNAGIKGIKFSENNKVLLSYCGYKNSPDNTIKLWTIEKNEPIQALNYHSDTINYCEFSRNNRYVISCSEDKTAVIWDIAEGNILQRLNNHNGAVNYAAFSANCKLVITCCQDGIARLWEVESGEELQVLAGHEGPISYGEFSSNNKYVVTSSQDMKIGIWQVEGGKLLHMLSGHKGRINKVKFSKDNNKIISCSDDMTIRIWDVKEGKLLKILTGHESYVKHCEFDNNGTKVVSCSYDKTVRIWELNFHSELSILDDKLENINYGVISNSGKIIAGTMGDNKVTLWEADNSQPSFSLEGHTAPVDYVEFNKEDTLLVSAAQDKTLIIWDLEKKEIKSTLIGHKIPADHALFSNDNKLLLSCSWSNLSDYNFDNIVYLWEVESGKLLHRLKGHQHGLNCAEFSSDSKRIITCSRGTLLDCDFNNTVCIWDVKTGNKIHEFYGHEYGINHSCFSGDNKYAASCSDDTTVRVWDLKADKPIKTLIGHKTSVNYVLFSSNNKKLASFSDDKIVKIWDIKNGNEPLELADHESSLKDIRFINNDDTLITCLKNTIRLWNTETGELQALYYLKSKFLDLKLVFNEEEPYLYILSVKPYHKIPIVHKLSVVGLFNEEG